MNPAGGRGRRKAGDRAEARGAVGAGFAAGARIDPFFTINLPQDLCLAEASGWQARGEA